MKNYYILILLFTGCSFYNPEVTVTVKGLSPGSVTISSPSSYFNQSIHSEKSIEVNILKGETYSLEFKPIFYNQTCRFTSGAIISSNDLNVTVSPYLGILAKISSLIHREGYSIKSEYLYDLQNKLLSGSDPWIYNEDDIKFYLLGQISLGSISKKKKYDIPELDQYLTWEPENPLFDEWYKSVQSFYKNNRRFRVEIYDNGSYCGFEEVN